MQRARAELGLTRALFRRHGATGVAVRTVQRLVPPSVLHLQWFLVAETWVPVRGPGDPWPPDVRWATRDDAVAVGDLGTGAEAVATRIDLGDHCIIVEHDGRPVAQLFATRRPWNETGLLFHLPADAWWVMDGYVDPAWRGRRLHGHLWDTMTSRLPATGPRVRTISTVDVLNDASRRSADHRGARVIGRGFSAETALGYVTRQRWAGQPATWRCHRRPRRVDVPR